MNTQKTAIATTRADNFAEWYQQAIRDADLAESSAVRGCMIIKPWGYAIWELMQADLDRRIKEAGHVNCYFPLFIPLSLIQREATHVSGFAKEMAVVTHHRVEADENGKLLPAAPLEEPLIVRPTSETIIGEALSAWVQSYRDLPLLLNQWANVVRWEMRPRLFLRTTEFLWQEGHTVHATREEAKSEQSRMLHVYSSFLEEFLSMPSIAGEKSPNERFPGADSTFSVEAMMQDGKALQSGTSHDLGQNFAKAANIRFQDKYGAIRHPFMTSWGASTRLVGALIMCHGDDNGLRLPTRVAPQHVVIIPLLRGEQSETVTKYCNNLATRLRNSLALKNPIRCLVDARQMRPPEKRWDWIKKGVPLICEIGPRDIIQKQVSFTYRNSKSLQRQTGPIENFPEIAITLLEGLHSELLDEAQGWLHARTISNIRGWSALTDYFLHDEDVRYDQRPAFVRAKWSGHPGSEERLEDLGLAIRNIPFEQTMSAGRCIVTGAPATQDVILAKSY